MSAGSDFLADEDDRFPVGHRLVGHGNRFWASEGEEFDVSWASRAAWRRVSGYDARFSAYRWDSFLSGANLVHAGRITEKIEAGEYDLENPLSGEQAHLDAIAYSRVREEEDSGLEALSARLALGRIRIRDRRRDVAWTAGVELGSFDRTGSFGFAAATA